jgi:hypothetical protein
MRSLLWLNVLRRPSRRFQLFLLLARGDIHVNGCLYVLPLTVEWGRHHNGILRCSIATAPIEWPSRVVFLSDYVSTGVFGDIIVLDTHLRSPFYLPCIHAYVQIFFGLKSLRSLSFIDFRITLRMRNS